MDNDTESTTMRLLNHNLKLWVMKLLVYCIDGSLLLHICLNNNNNNKTLYQIKSFRRLKNINNHLIRRNCFNEKKNLKKLTEFRKEVKFEKNEKVKILLLFMKEKSQD